MKTIAALSLIALGFAANAAPPRKPWEHARRLTTYHAECIMKRQGEGVSAWLALLSGSNGERKAFQKLQRDFPACFGASRELDWEYSFEAVPVREALISYLLRRSWASVPLTAPGRLDTPQWYDTAILGEAGAAEAALTHSVGKCIARTDWPSSRALAGAASGSTDEGAAFARIVAVLPGCVPPRATIKFARPRLRAIVEEAVYHASVGGTDA